MHSLYPITGLGLLALANFLLANATVDILKYAQRHIDSPRTSEVLIFMVIYIFLIVPFVIYLMTISAKSQKSKRSAVVHFTIFGVIFIDTAYWLVALIAADSACIQCNEGHLPILFFWVKEIWLH